MPSELEGQLERALRYQRPASQVEDRALDLALAALPPPAGRSRRLRTLVIALAAAAVVLAIAAGALATAGALHVTLGGAPKEPRAPSVATLTPRLRVPGGAAAVAAIVDGRLWLSTRDGLRIQGLPVASATLSPHALYVAAGVGRSLVALRPDGTRAWSHPAGGRVVAISWAPDALRIGYVVETKEAFELRTIEGNGTHDRLLDARVRPVAPSWRADSLAVAYVGAGGRPVIYDFGHDSHLPLRGTSLREATRVSFAPSGTALAVTSAHALTLTGVGSRRSVRRFGTSSTAGAGWLDGRVVVALNNAALSERATLETFSVAAGGRLTPAARLGLPGRVAALDASGSLLVAAVQVPHVAARVLASSATSPPGRLALLLDLPPGTRVDAIVVR